MDTKILVCPVCGQIIEVVKDKNIPIVCCGKPMEELKANTVDASQEKHVPVVEISGDTVNVKVGSAAHPMEEDHFIEWIYLKTENGGQRKYLNPGDAPEASFNLGGEKAVAVYEYCNLHGLWMTEV